MAELALPETVTAAPVKKVENTGTISVPFHQGMVLLKDQDGKYRRLSWNEIKNNKKNTVRAVAAGVYKVATYRVHKRDKKSDEWFLSVTKPHLHKIKVQPGHSHKIQLKSEIHLKLSARRTDNALRVNVLLMDEHGGGLSIYRKGKRIPLHYRIEDSQGKELARGALKYG